MSTVKYEIVQCGDLQYGDLFIMVSHKCNNIDPHGLIVCMYVGHGLQVYTEEANVVTTQENAHIIIYPIPSNTSHNIFTWKCYPDTLVAKLVGLNISDMFSTNILRIKAELEEQILIETIT